MKALFIGGIKSGKSYNAEQYTLGLISDAKPVYLATTELLDDEMQERISLHQQQRLDSVITVEEPMDLIGAIQKQQGPVLIECTTMWINNMLYHDKTKEQILEHINSLLALPNEIIFVHNDVGAGIIPDNALARQYIDISGTVSQIIARQCDEVFHCIAGIATKIK